MKKMSKLAKKRIKEKVDCCLTVGQLKEILKDLPDDMLVGKSGHFGEFNDMHPCDIYESKAYITDGSWRSGNKQDIEFLQITSPDIGPDPD